MTNIQKLYELAGIKEKHGIELTVDPTSEEPKFNEHYVCYGYPPFTPEMQLEIIKWFGKNFDIIRYWINDSEYIVEINGIFGNNKDFSQALADLICELWDDLTPEQREQIKRILE